MLKKLLALLSFTGATIYGFSQCALEKWSLEKRIDLSTAVVEGKVVDQYPFRENGKNSIYTASVIEVYKVFKGQFTNPYHLEIITFGGQINLERHHADPELEIQTGDIGVFLLTANKVDLPDLLKNNDKLKFQGIANVHSFISYDLDENKAFDISKTHYGITTEFYETLQEITKNPYLNIKSSGYYPDKLKYRPTAGPVITSFTSTANAGTGDFLTVRGQGFGNTRGKGRIEFIDANYGDGRKFKTPYGIDYSAWTDTMVKVRIPSRAGSGAIRIATNDSGSFSPFNTIKINFSHLNVSYIPTGGQEQYYPTYHVNDNNKGGYTWQFNQRFKASSGMVNSFLRSLQTWRCGTYMNWDVGRDTNIKVTTGDKINIVRLTQFTDNTLAKCYSYWNGCSSGSNVEWYTYELDIEVDSTRKWYSGTGNPANGEYDLESVLSHELGHGHQLGHVISSTEMMNYSIANGEKKRTLSTDDLKGGNYVKSKSVTANLCALKPLVALDPSACGYTKLLAGFSTNKLIACPHLPIILSDTTVGVTKTYLWNFGKNANPAISTGKGPHTVKYDSSGTKTIKLFVSNDFGTDSTIKSGYLEVLPAKPQIPINLVYDDTACLTTTTLGVDSFSGPVTLSWKFPPQATEINNTKNTKKITWNSSGGPFAFWVKSVNICGSSDSITGSVIVLNDATVGFTATENGRVVTFVNSSQFATQYRWLFGDGDSSNLSDPVHTYPAGKPYNATLKSTNHCKTVSKTMQVNPFHPLSSEKIEFVNSLAYPNPASNILYLSKEVISYALFDPTGQLLIRGNDTFIDLNHLRHGLYMMQAQTNDGALYFIKIIKE